jgi:hypothetical protein
MNTHVQNTILELGTFSIVVPELWAVAALIGLMALANWPELFAEQTAAAQTTVQTGSSPSDAQPATTATTASFEL